MPPPVAAEGGAGAEYPPEEGAEKSAASNAVKSLLCRKGNPFIGSQRRTFSYVVSIRWSDMLRSSSIFNPE